MFFQSSNKEKSEDAEYLNTFGSSPQGYQQTKSLWISFVVALLISAGVWIISLSWCDDGAQKQLDRDAVFLLDEVVQQSDAAVKFGERLQLLTENHQELGANEQIIKKAFQNLADLGLGSAVSDAALLIPSSSSKYGVATSVRYIPLPLSKTSNVQEKGRKNFIESQYLNFDLSKVRDSGSVKIVSFEYKQALHKYFLVVLSPLYKKEANQPFDRRKNYIGVAAIEFSFVEWLPLASQSYPDYLHIIVANGGWEDPPMVSSLKIGRGLAIAQTLMLSSQKNKNIYRWVSKKTLTIGGRTFSILFASNDRPPESPPIWIAFFMGWIVFLFSILVWMVYHSFAGAKEKALNLAQKAVGDIEKQRLWLEQAAVMAGVGHWRFQMDSKHFIFSERSRAVLGFQSKKVSFEDFFNAITVDSQPSWLRWMASVMKKEGGGSSKEQEVCFRFKNGTTVVWLQMIGASFREHATAPQSIQGSIMDVSAKSQDGQVLHLRHELGMVVATVHGHEINKNHLSSFDGQVFFVNFMEKLATFFNLQGGVIHLREDTESAIRQDGSEWCQEGWWFAKSIKKDDKVFPMSISNFHWEDRPWEIISPTEDHLLIGFQGENDFGLVRRWCLPLIESGKTVGWIELFGKKESESLVFDLQLNSIRETIQEELFKLKAYRDHYVKLSYLAGSDALTGLMSRYKFGENLQNILNQHNDKAWGLLFIDLDGFKKVNDALGHYAGDIVLKEITSRFKECLSDGDFLGRVGGDEFAALTLAGWTLDSQNQERCVDYQPMLDLAHRFLKVTEAPFQVEGQTFYLGVSIGIVAYPDDATTAAEMLKCADIAMYSVKKSKKNGVMIYAKNIEEDVRVKNEMETALKNAIEKNEMHMVFQPKFIIENDVHIMVGVEALIRWNRPGIGMIPPMVFMALAEESGMVHQIGAWTITTAIRHMSKWKREHNLDIPVSINLSAKQFLEEQSLGGALLLADELDIPSFMITLEVTETCLMESPKRAAEILWGLHQKGFRVSIDDFGTGYSSLAYLRNFHVDEIKIDRSFVINMAQEFQDMAIVEAILNIAKSLRMDVVAEGVETEEQKDLLKNNNCNIYQGFFFSQPLTDSDLLEKIHKKIFILSGGAPHD